MKKIIASILVSSVCLCANAADNKVFGPTAEFKVNGCDVKMYLVKTEVNTKIGLSYDVTDRLYIANCDSTTTTTAVTNEKNSKTTVNIKR